MTVEPQSLSVADGDWISPGQAALKLGVSREWIRALIRAGRLGATRTPLGHLVLGSDVDRLAAERQARLRQGGARVANDAPAA